MITFFLTALSREYLVLVRNAETYLDAKLLPPLQLGVMISVQRRTAPYYSHTTIDKPTAPWRLFLILYCQKRTDNEKVHTVCRFFFQFASTGKDTDPTISDAMDNFLNLCCLNGRKWSSYGIHYASVTKQMKLSLLQGVPKRYRL